MTSTSFVQSTVIEPGDRYTFAFSDPLGAQWRPKHIVIDVSPNVPEIAHYLRRGRAGSSRKRGRRASWAWSAACLRHRRTRWPADVRITDIVIDGLSYLLTPLPSFALAPNAIGNDALVLGTGKALHIIATNADEERSAFACVFVAGQRDSRLRPRRAAL